MKRIVIQRKHFRSQREQFVLEYLERAHYGQLRKDDPTPEQFEKYVRYPRIIKKD